FSTRSEDGYLQIGYESWRPGSRERICGFAHRRVRELNLESVNVLNEHWEEQHEHAYNREQTAYVHTPNRGPREIELAAGYVSARVIRRCLLTLEQAAD
ncbi:MAG: hypothetical protein V2I38_16805, partial [Alcanivoracaceae bacterium]|nr:hypothetical protein [Alcanivoracaceae bacterium]